VIEMLDTARHSDSTIPATCRRLGAPFVSLSQR
jgi:hypothetical protein